MIPDSGVVFHIDGECSIYRAAELAASLQAWLQQVPPDTSVLTLDLSQVQELDSAGLQLLLSLQRSVQEQQRCLQLTDVSPAVRAVLQLLQPDLLPLHGAALAVCSDES